MSTVRDLIQGSLRLIGVLASGETPSADEQADALSTLNDMLDSWSNESLVIYAKVREEFDMIVGQAAYTIGSDPAADFETTRPQKIEVALIQYQSTGSDIEMPVIIINRDQYASIALKDMQSTFPTRLYAEGTYPFETINLWPVPSSAHKLILYSWKPLTEFASANTVIELPPGYKKALRYNLAIELSAEYGREPSTAIVAGAMEGKENIKRMNIKPYYLEVDQALTQPNSTFNILTGE